MKTAIEHLFSGPTTGIDAYDPAKTGMGTLMTQNTGLTAIERWMGPTPIAITRPMEASVAIGSGYPFVITVDATIDHILLSEIAAGANRRVSLYVFNKVTHTFAWQGYITIAFPATGNHTIRGLRAVRDLHSTGTIAVSGTAVTGSGTDWADSRLSAGARIGFGTTNPLAVTQWFDIESITDNSGITLATDGGSVSAGTPYVIEELRIVIATTCNTAANGGLFLAKGIHPGVFQQAGTTIAAATTDDRRRAVYWLADASTVTNTVAGSCAIDEKISDTEQYVYVTNGTTSLTLYKYNIRTDLSSLTAGKSLDALAAKTGAVAVTGTTSQTNNGRVATANHGPGAGVPSLYFVTTTRVYRAPLSLITNGSTSFLADSMVEVPPGGSSTYPATNVMASIEYSGEIDRFAITTTGASSARSYVTRYQTTSDPFDHIFLIDTKQTDQSIADSGGVAHPTINAGPMSVWIQNGRMYLCRQTGTIIQNQLYTLPAAAHWAYAGVSGQRIITPALPTVGATVLYRAYVNAATQLGSGTLGMAPEPYRVSARTSGISDNSGAWTLLDDAHDLTGIAPGDAIQFMFEFKIFGLTCIPNRLYGLTVTYEDAGTDSHYSPSVSHSSLADNRVAWRQATPWDGNIPTLRIRLYNAANGDLVLSDDTDLSENGTWERSVNGTSWLAWDAAESAVGSYIRYTADTLPGSITARAVLTQ